MSDRMGSVIAGEPSSLPDKEQVPAAPELTMFPHSDTAPYWISGQLNVVYQANPGFHSPYQGPNSFHNAPEYKTSIVDTLFLGFQPHRNLRYNTDFIVDFEEAGGRGLSEALGIAGFTNLDVVRNPNLSSSPFYQDLPGQPFFEETLRSDALGISGKPDCLVRAADGTVPVELMNSSRPPARGGVYANHMVQALAYCALVEDQMKVRVPYALVIYAGQQVRKVEFTEERRQWLFRTIREVELARARMTANRSHDHRGRCVGCGVRSQCDQALL